MARATLDWIDGELRALEQKGLRRGLEPHCELLVEKEATDALLKILEEPPDMIISDFRMPGMDGRQLFEKLRSRDRSSQKARTVKLANKAA